MKSCLRTGLAASIVGLPLAFAACGVYQRSFDEAPVDSDRIDMVVALDAQNRGDDAGTVRAYQRMERMTGHPLADLQLGRYYAEGRGVPKDPVKAAQYLQAAYTKDWPRRGDAAFYLGRLYLNGEGVPQDDKKAFELFSFARSQGVMQASYQLGQAYDEGKVVTRDLTKARAYYAEAAAQNDGRAALRLAELDADAGVAPEQVMAEAKPGIAWLRGLAKEDNDWAEMRLATIYDEGKLAPASSELADRYLRDAAKHGNGSANARMAEREEQAGDPKKALTYWRRAAEAGHPSGMVKLGFAALDAGRTSEGLDWLEKAVALGHPSAMVEIGRRQLTGDGLPQDPQAGIAMLEKAAAMGHPSAMYDLGQAYANGTGVPKDTAQARLWFEKAQAAGHASAAKALAQLQGS